MKYMYTYESYMHRVVTKNNWLIDWLILLYIVLSARLIYRCSILQKMTTWRQQNILLILNIVHNKLSLNNVITLIRFHSNHYNHQVFCCMHVLIYQNSVFCSINSLFIKKLIFLFLLDLSNVCILLTSSDNVSEYIRRW